MIIIANEEQAFKSSLKDFPKIVISEMLLNNDKYLEDLQESSKLQPAYASWLLPPTELAVDYINGVISKDTFAKRYKNMIKEDDELFSCFLAMMLAYKTHEHMVLICHTNELEFGYMWALCKFISKRYNVSCSLFKDWKKLSKKQRNTFEINKERLSKDVSNNFSLLFDGEEVEEKNKKRKEKHSKIKVSFKFKK